MSFADALRFPFKKDVLPKIFKFVLFYLLISLLMVAATFVFPRSNQLAYFYAGLVVAFVVFIVGYNIEIIRHIASRQEGLPNIQLKRDFQRAFMLFLSNIAHAIPFFILYIFVAGFLNPNIASYGYSRSAGGGTFFMLCGFWIVMMVMSFFIHGAMQVGLIRYAFEDHSDVPFQFSSNLDYVRENKAFMFGFFLRAFGITLAYGVSLFVLSWLISVGFAQLYRSIGFATWLIVTASLLSACVQVAIVIAYQFAIAHLQAGLGFELGISPEKVKNEVYIN